MNRSCFILWSFLLLLLGRLATSGTECHRAKQTIRAATLLGIMGFYLGTSEWCHAQRDTWMLLPCLLALLIRINVLRRTEDNRAATSGMPVRQLALTTLEGILWAAGFWLKPFVAIPAVAVAVLIGSLRFSLTVRA